MKQFATGNFNSLLCHQRRKFHAADLYQSAAQSFIKFRAIGAIIRSFRQGFWEVLEIIENDDHCLPGWILLVPHEPNERQQENRKTTCEMLLARSKRKSFLHRIVIGDEKWIYSAPGEPPTSTTRPNRYGRKTMPCVWWDQKGVIYYELLKPGETVNTERYRQQSFEWKTTRISKKATQSNFASR